MKAPLIKHAGHPVEIKPSSKPPHSAYYYCVKCRVWVAWLSKKQAQQAEELGLL